MKVNTHRRLLIIGNNDSCWAARLWHSDTAVQLPNPRLDDCSQEVGNGSKTRKPRLQPRIESSDRQNAASTESNKTCRDQKSNSSVMCSSAHPKNRGSSICFNLLKIVLRRCGLGPQAVLRWQALWGTFRGAAYLGFGEGRSVNSDTSALMRISASAEPAQPWYLVRS